MSIDAEKVRDSIDRMINYCERIAFHMHRFGGRENLLEDWSYQDACVMILGQIGEEAKKIEPWLKSNSDYPWKEVIHFRDFEYHNYFDTDYNLIWGIISEDVPRLLDVLIELSEKLEVDMAFSIKSFSKKRLFSRHG